MKEFIYRIEDNESDESEVFIGWIRKQGHELVRCRDCKWYLPNYTESPFDTDGFDRWGGLANCQNENGLTECSDESYCSCGERRKEE